MPGAQWASFQICFLLLNMVNSCDVLTAVSWDQTKQNVQLHVRLSLTFLISKTALGSLPFPLKIAFRYLYRGGTRVGQDGHVPWVQKLREQFCKNVKWGRQSSLLICPACLEGLGAG